VFWIPEGLASRWIALPRRIGYAVDPVPDNLKRSYWRAHAIGQIRGIENGYLPRMEIDEKLIETVISQDCSGLVITGSTVIHIAVGQDHFRLYDSTCSWWMEMTALGAGKQLGYSSHVEYQRKQLFRSMNILAFAFVASGAQLASQNPIEKGFGWGLGKHEELRHVYRCPLELALHWTEKLLKPHRKCKLVPACPAPYPTPEQYMIGTRSWLLGGVDIFAGPAFDQTWDASAFLSFETFGYFPPKRFVSELEQRATTFGAKRLAP
jgi:hypothetical protein